MQKIMIVEDNELILKAFVGYLKIKGYDVIGVVTGEEALEVFQEEHPRIIILDIGLPGKDGMQVFKELKQQDPSVKIAMVSGHHEFKAEMLAQGADGYLIKPLMPPDLEAWIESQAA